MSDGRYRSPPDSIALAAEKMYTLFEHTADMGIHVESPTLEGLYADAACGLFAIICDAVDSIREQEEHVIRVTGADREYLLVDWLSELLAAFDLRRLLFRRFQVAHSASGLVGTAFGELWDPTRHPLGHEVKAITYSGLRVALGPAGWEADVIVDL